MGAFIISQLFGIAFVCVNQSKRSRRFNGSVDSKRRKGRKAASFCVKDRKCKHFENKLIKKEASEEEGEGR